MRSIQTLKNYPTRLHEDWRYFFLKPDAFEALLAGTSPATIQPVLPEPGATVNSGPKAGQLLAEAGATPTVPDDVFTDMTQSAPLELVIVEQSTESVQSIHIETPDDATAVNRNLAIIIRPGVRADVLVRTDAAGARSLLNGRLRIVVQAGASCRFALHGLNHADSFSVIRVQGTVAADATLRMFSLATGDGRTRMDVAVALDGENGELTLDQAVLAGNEAINDTVVKMIHAAPQTRSDMNTLTYAGGTSQSILNGLIRVMPEAADVEAYQQARNYILSETAYSVGYPQLEIENPDVACSHGTTMHTFDENQLYYLASRGIEPEAARALILKGHLDYFFRNLDEATKERFLNHGYAKIDQLIS